MRHMDHYRFHTVNQQIVAGNGIGKIHHPLRCTFRHLDTAGNRICLFEFFFFLENSYQIQQFIVKNIVVDLSHIQFL